MKTWIAVFAALCASSVLAVKEGDSRAAVLAELGKPQGKATMGRLETLIYPGGKIELENGTVTYIDAGFEETAKKAAADAAFASEQKARGLIERGGQWVTAEQARSLDEQKAADERLKVEVARRQAELESARNAARPAATTPSASSRVKVIRDQGQRVEIASLLQPGKVTIVDFFADWCGPCRALTPLLEHHVAKHADVYLCKVDIVKWGTPVTAQHRINSVPYVCVYGRDGRLVGTPTHDGAKITAHIEQALK